MIRAALGKPLSLLGFLRSIIDRMKAVIIRTTNHAPNIKFVFKALTNLLNKPPDIIFSILGRRENMQITKERIPNFEYFKFDEECFCPMFSAVSVSICIQLSLLVDKCIIPYNSTTSNSLQHSKPSCPCIGVNKNHRRHIHL